MDDENTDECGLKARRYVAELRVKNVAGQAGQLDAPTLITEADVGRRWGPPLHPEHDRSASK